MTHTPTVASERETGAKGLSTNAVGLLGAVIIGISCIAPAYTLTGALGPTVAAVGTALPGIFLVGFIPMLLTAFGYKELVTSMPDSGTSFTWGVRAFGPWIGWMSGWGLVIATIVVLSNLAGIAVDFFYLAVAQVFNQEWIAALKDNVAVNVITCLAFMAVATAISYRDMQTTQRFQYILVTFQLIIMVGFGGVMMWQAYNGSGFNFTPIELSWFNPFNVDSFGTFAAGISLSLFIFWGWDVTLTMSEETKGGRSTPGKAATLTIIAVVSIYLFVSLGAMSYAGVGDEGIGLGNPAIQENVFFALATPVLGTGAILMSLAVLSSSAASLQSTFVSPARTLLAMGHYGAISPKFARVSPRFFTPSYATFVSAIVASVFYAVMRVLSENVLWDTIATLGIMIAFYYGLTAFACVWYFRKQWFASARNFFFQFLFPLIGGIILFILLVQTMVESIDPAFGSGSQIGGIGLVFILGMLMLGAGVVLMFYCYIRFPDFFKGKTLVKGLPEDENAGLAKELAE
ncbi:MAG: APC family permease [Actinomycetaceae bacterium]|nr:APC family permease [Actinomycetaceae bacterium]